VKSKIFPKTLEREPEHSESNIYIASLSQIGTFSLLGPDHSFPAGKIKIRDYEGTIHITKYMNIMLD